MSLATLNKQRALEKQQPQSIKTTVTISSVSKTPVGSSTPLMSDSRKIAADSVSVKSVQSSVASSDSRKTVRDVSLTPSASPDSPEESLIAKRRDSAKDKFLNEEPVKPRRGEFSIHDITWPTITHNEWKFIHVSYDFGMSSSKREKKHTF